MWKVRWLTLNSVTFIALIKCYKEGELAYLLARYERWLLKLHEQLDDFPDELMSMYVVLPQFYSHALGESPVTVRDCLLYAVEQSALHAGHIQLMCRLYADFERQQEEFLQGYADDDMQLEMVNREQIN